MKKALERLEIILEAMGMYVTAADDTELMFEDDAHETRYLVKYTTSEELIFYAGGEIATGFTYYSEDADSVFGMKAALAAVTTTGYDCTRVEIM